MRRYLALFLPLLPTERWRLSAAGGAPDEAAPFALVEKQNNAQRLYALNPAALDQGLAPGLALADARARLPQLASPTADRPADRALLLRLAARCERYTPLTALDEPHGLVLDVVGLRPFVRRRSGAAVPGARGHAGIGLFRPRRSGADARLRARSGAFFRWRNFLAGRRGRGGRAPAARRSGGGRGDVFRLEPRRASKRIGDLAARPSGGFAARFGADFPRRIERLLGREDLRITPLAAAARLHGRAAFRRAFVAARVHRGRLAAI